MKINKTIYLLYLDSLMVVKGYFSPKYDLSNVFKISTAQSTRIVRQYRDIYENKLVYNDVKFVWESGNDFKPKLVDSYNKFEMATEIIKCVSILWGRI